MKRCWIYTELEERKIYTFVKVELFTLKYLESCAQTRDKNPTGPGFGPGPKTLIFLNFKNPEPGPKPECDFPETLNPNPNPKFKNLGPAENPVQFFYETEIGK